MNDRNCKIDHAVSALLETLKVLRSEDGCPWDRAQSMDDIITNLIDEGYELLQAEKSGNTRKIVEELGDVLYLAVFIYMLLLERTEISLGSIISQAHGKIIRRHPHVFEDSERATTVSDSISEWERVKKSEKKEEDTPHKDIPHALEPFPPGITPLRKAKLLQKMAADLGFDWPDAGGIMNKLDEEREELAESIKSKSPSRIKDEIGDLLFTLVNLARRLDVEPENALEGTTSKFIRRFRRMEELSAQSGEKLESMSLERMEQLWQESKKHR